MANAFARTPTEMQRLSIISVNTDRDRGLIGKVDFVWFIPELFVMLCDHNSL